MNKVLDANVVLRFLLKDDVKLYNFAEGLLKKAKRADKSVNILAITVFEIVYVLEKTYKFPRHEVSSGLSSFLNSPHIYINNLDVLNNALKAYSKIKIDLQDIYLFYYAEKYDLEVVSFDNDFIKLSRLLSS